jgi:hypothetical protein
MPATHSKFSESAIDTATARGYSAANAQQGAGWNQKQGGDKWNQQQRQQS